MATKIEWTDATWSPITGCTRVSAGCDHCYSAALSKRLAAMGQRKYQGIVGNGHFNGVVKTWDDELSKPLRWRKPRRIFVNSMSDTFHKEVPFEFIDKVFAVMALCPQHTFQVLTKRPERMADYFADIPSRTMAVIEAIAAFVGRDAPFRGQGLTTHFNDTENIIPAANIWLGTSVEDQRNADERIPHLLRCPAAVRFLSCEPLLGPVDLVRAQCKCPWPADAARTRHLLDCPADIRPFKGDQKWGIDWVIVGGESGHGARPMHPDWARSLRDQCQAAGVSYFFKQWGEWAPLENHRVMVPSGNYAFTPSGEKVTEHDKRQVHVWPATQIESDDSFSAVRLGKKAAGRLLDGREWNEFPQATERVKV